MHVSARNDGLSAVTPLMFFLLVLSCLGLSDYCDLKQFLVTKYQLKEIEEKRRRLQCVHVFDNSKHMRLQSKQKNLK